MSYRASYAFAFSAAEATLAEERQRLTKERTELGAVCFAKLASALDAVTASSDGKQIAVTQDTTVVVFDEETGEIRQELHAPVGSLTSVAFTLSGNSLLAGGNEHVVYQWDVDTGRLSRQQEVPDEWLFNIVVSSDRRHFFKTGGEIRGSPHNPTSVDSIRMWSLYEDDQIKSAPR